MKEKILQIPKIELHCHLDGSVSREGIEEICRSQGGMDERETERICSHIKAPEICEDLAEYLTCFDYVLPLLQTKKALELAAYDVIRQAAKENVIYIEVRFAPMFHCQNGLTQEAAVAAVLKGLERGEQDFGVMSRALLCMMRGQEETFNQITLETARNLQAYGVAGLDLAGNEAAYPPELYRELFGQAEKYEIPFTIHGGECGSVQNVETSVKMGAKRIGHGVAIVDNREVKALCIRENVCLEMCPVSNIQTRAVADMRVYPFEKMRKEGVPVTINTDNRTVSDTNLTKEWTVLKSFFPEAEESWERILRETMLQGISHAFLPESEKETLRRRVLK